MAIPGSRGPKFGPDALVTQLESYQFRKQRIPTSQGIYSTVPLGTSVSDIDFGGLSDYLLLTPLEPITYNVDVSQSEIVGGGASGTPTTDYLRTALYAYDEERGLGRYIQNSEGRYNFPGAALASVGYTHTRFKLQANTQLLLAVIPYSPSRTMLWKGVDVVAPVAMRFTIDFGATNKFPEVLYPSMMRFTLSTGVMLPQVAYKSAVFKELF